MHAWQMTPEEFHGSSAGLPGQPDLWDMGFGQVAAVMMDVPRGKPLAAGYAPPSYKIQPVNTIGDFVAVDASGSPVGALIGGNIGVDTPHKRRGLGLSLLRAAWEEQPWPPNHPHALSQDGAKLMTALHRDLVHEAIRDRLPVPAHVAERYPFSWGDVLYDRFLHPSLKWWDRVADWGFRAFLLLGGPLIIYSVKARREALLAIIFILGIQFYDEQKNYWSLPKTFREKNLIISAAMGLAPAITTMLAVWLRGF